MILAALPIFTGTYASLVARRRPRRAWLVGSAVALVGEVVLIGARGGGGGDATLVGDLLVLAAALVVSAGYVAGAMLPPRGVSSAAATYWGVVLGALVLTPLALGLFAADGAPEAGPAAWGAVLFLAAVTSIVGYVGWYWALRPRRHPADRDAPVPPAAVGVRARGARARRGCRAGDRNRCSRRDRRGRDRAARVAARPGAASSGPYDSPHGGPTGPCARRRARPLGHRGSLRPAGTRGGGGGVRRRSRGRRRGARRRPPTRSVGGRAPRRRGARS